jgi:GWxTD domain-containing protein
MISPIARRLLYCLWMTALLAAPIASTRALAAESHEDGRAGTHQLTKEEQEQRLRDFKKEVGKTFQDWLNKDVRYLITPEEKRAFKLLGSDAERDAFIEQFWRRRDPTPGTELNEYREEHYRRLQYANERFGAGVPGWQTDRGHMYIVWGPPDEIDSHPTGGLYQRDVREGGGMTSTFPYERWRYRHLEGIGDQVVIEFVDSCQCGDYRIATDPNEKDALLHVPGAGSTMMEQLGVASRTSRITGIPDASNPNSPQSGTNQFEALERYNKLNATAPVKFTKLQELVNTRVRYDLLPFELQSDFVRMGPDRVLVPITIQIRTGDLTFLKKQGIERAAANIFGRITTLSGRVATIFEDTVGVDQPVDLLPKVLDTKQMYWKAVALKPGMYKLEVAIEDVNGKRAGTLARSLRVPVFDDETLSSSTLILADLMERVSARRVGSSRFILGDTKVRPRPAAGNGQPAIFNRNQKLNIWLQVYNLRPDPASRKPSATISYDIVNVETGKNVLHTEESSTAYAAGGGQITIEKSMPLIALAPGLYNLKIAVNDVVSRQSITPSARFRVE